MNKIALVTGVGGFLGSHLVEYLVEKGYHVRATDLEAVDNENITYIKKLPDVEFLPADLTKKETLNKLFIDVEKVFHPASLFDYSASWESLYKVNVEGMKNICEVASKYAISVFIHVSTEGVYGIPKYLPVKEDHPKEPLNDYNRSKLMQEEVALEYYKKEKLPIVIIRPAPMYGPRSRYGLATVGNIIIHGQLPFAALCLKKYKVAAVHIKDVCAAAEFLSTKQEAIGEAYNIVDDALYSIYDMLIDLAQLSGGKMYRIAIPHIVVRVFLKILAAYLTKYCKKKNIRPPIEKETLEYLLGNFWFSNEKIKKLGYKFHYPDLKIGMRETMMWYIKEGWV